MKTNLISYPITVQFEDVDRYNIVHHTKLIAYLERARVHFLMQQGYDFNTSSTDILLYNLAITFKKPAQLLDELSVAVSLKSVESFRLTLTYKIKRDSELIAKAESDIAFIDSTTKEIVPIPKELSQ